MIAKENYEEAHIRDLQDKSHRDPGLIERTEDTLQYNKN